MMDKILKLLNEAAKADPEAIKNILNYKVECNKALLNHPTIQVKFDLDSFICTPFGLINGIVEELTGKRVVAIYDEDGELFCFSEYNDELIKSFKK